jgi:hypothetical protein
MTEEETRRRLIQVLEENQRSSAGPGERGVEEVKDPRGIKREAEEAAEAEFMERYKARRLEDGRVEVDLTDD